MVVITNKINTGKKASVSSVNPWVQKLYFIYSVDRALVKIRDLESIISPNEGGYVEWDRKRRGEVRLNLFMTKSYLKSKY